MKPHALLAACSLLGLPALVAASDYPPPMGPYRTPATLEFLADQARAILDALGSSDAADRPKGGHAVPPKSFTSERTASLVEGLSRTDLRTEVTSDTYDGTPVSPHHWTTWKQAGAAPLELPTSTLHSPAYSAAESGVSPKKRTDSQMHYAQAPTAGWQPAKDPYAAAPPYPASRGDAGYYEPARVHQGYRDTASLPNWEYRPTPYREPFPAPRQNAGKAGPDAWSYYPMHQPTGSSPSPDYYDHPYLGGQAQTPGVQAYPSSPPGTTPVAGTGPYPPDPWPPAYSSVPGDSSSHYGGYGVDPYSGWSQESAPYEQGQATYAPGYGTTPAESPGLSLPAHKASYSRDLRPSSSGYTRQEFGGGVGEGAYRPMPEEHRWNYDADYRGGYLTPGAAPMAQPDANAPAVHPFRYRELDPTSSRLYYGDYEFAPLPRPPGDADRQTGLGQGQPSDAKRWYRGGDFRPSPSQSRSAGALPNAVTGPEGQVYRYRPLEQSRPKAPNARTWEAGGYDGRQDYPNQRWSYPEDRPADFRARR